MDNIRNQWIDILKGIGILLIVIGHIIDGPIKEFLYLFHVPIFFFLSGYLYRHPKSFSQFIVKKIKRLLIPYFIFLFTFTMVLIIQQCLVKNDDISANNYLLSALLGGQYLTGFFAVFWFITSLFFTQVIYAYLQRFNQKIIISVMITSLIFAYLTSVYNANLFTFWSFNTVFFTLPIYFVGHLSKSYKYSLIGWFAVVTALILLPLYFMFSDYFIIDIKANIYGVPIFSLLLSLSLVILTFILSQRLESLKLISKLLAYLGGMSMTIMYMHQPIQISLKYVLNLKEPFLLIIITILLSLITHEIFKRNKITKQYILGQSK